MRGATAQVQARAALYLRQMTPVEVTACEEVSLPLPQSGPQTDACESDAQIVFYGGHAGGGKTWWLQREALRHYANPLHRAALLRRTSKQARKPGSIWDSSTQMYQPFGARSRENSLDHLFNSGATISIGGCEHNKNRFDYDGSQFSFIGFDQVEGFTEIMFWYIALSRARTMSGIPTRIGATANPVHPKEETGGWLAVLLMRGGWIDEDTGYAIGEMSGCVKWFYRDRGDVHFFDTSDGAREQFFDKAARGVNPISMTFIEAKLADNKILEEADPRYRGNLEGLPWIDRKRLIGGNWKVSSAGGGIFRRKWVRILKRDPAVDDKEFYKGYRVRAWDFASTDESEGHAKDRTTSIIAGRAAKSGRIIFQDPTAGQLSPGRVKQAITETMLQDGSGITIRIPQDPGSAGKSQVADLLSHLRSAAADADMSPPRVVAVRPTGSKTARGIPFARAAEPASMDESGEVKMYGNVDVVDGPGVEEWLEELHHFDGSKYGVDDFWDCTADAYNETVPDHDAWIEPMVV